MMKRELRYWMWNAEEHVFVILAMSLAMTVFFSVLKGGGNSLWMCGIFILIYLVIYLGFWMTAKGMQAKELLSVSLMFSSTRRDGFLGMQFMMFVVLAQAELVQLLLLLLPFGNRTIQELIACYTPVVFLLMTGLGYLISILEEKNEKLYKVVLAVFTGCLGGIIGFSAVMLAGNSETVKDISRNAVRFFGGIAYVIIACIAIAVYAAGAGCYRKMAMNLDVQV